MTLYEIKSVFKNSDVSNLIENIFATCTSRNNISGLNIHNWLSQPPKFTTVRVNFPNTAKEAAKELQNILNSSYSTNDKQPPCVHIHSVITDLLIIPSKAHSQPVLPVEKEIIVDINCGSAVLRGADVFAPGVLGAPLNLKCGDTVSVYSDLAGKCLKGWSKLYNESKLFLGNGKALFSRQMLFNSTHKISGIAVKIHDPIIDSPSLGNNVLSKSMFLQNLPSVLCGHVLNPKPDDWVLDMCAAPGGKTTHLASLMKNQGIIIALDKTQSRLSKLETNVTFSSFENIYCFPLDATKVIDKTKTCEDTKLLRHIGKSIPPPFPPELFDCVLLDSPCSALGLRPQLSNKITINELMSYPKLQRKLIAAAVQLVRPNGILVYSTCSFTTAENEENVAWALQNFPSLKLEEQNPKIGGIGIQVNGLSALDCKMLQRFDHNTPGIAEDGDTIGFFIAKFKKTVSSN